MDINSDISPVSVRILLSLQRKHRQFHSSLVSILDFHFSCIGFATAANENNHEKITFHSNETKIHSNSFHVNYHQ